MFVQLNHENEILEQDTVNHLGKLSVICNVLWIFVHDKDTNGYQLPENKSVPMTTHVCLHLSL